ncbi:hypothetical protein PCO87_17315 [Pectobacteriaceae bacterium C52]|nr:hypothetical protein PCO87_17315 [Pectobacteriaceae bacterium C52]
MLLMKFGTAFARNAPPKKYDMRKSQGMSYALCRQEIDDVLACPGPSKPWEDMADAEIMDLGSHVDHGVDGESNVEQLLIGLACR